MSPVNIATTAGAVGDIYNGIALVPGVQAAGESGKLMVRGGDSRVGGRPLLTDARTIALHLYAGKFGCTGAGTHHSYLKGLISRQEASLPIIPQSCPAYSL